MTRQDVIAIREEVVRLDLSGKDQVSGLSIDDLEKAFNGTGPEFLPEKIRQDLDKRNRPLLPSVMVHDVDFTMSDGTVGGFMQANRRLLRNATACACASYPWNDLRRYVLILKAVALYSACKRFGWAAWILAYCKNQKGKNNE